MQTTGRLNARFDACTSARPAGRAARPPRRWWRQTGFALIASLAISRAATPRAMAQDLWNGATDNWDVAADWSTGLPDMTSDVVNNTSGAITHDSGTDVINSFLNSLSGGFNLTGGSLTINTTYQNTGSGSISVSGSGILNVLGDFTSSGGGAISVSGGAFNVGGNFSSNGDVSLYGGTLSGAVTGGVPTSSFTANGNLLIQGGTLSNFTIDASQSAAFTMAGGTISNSSISNSNLIQFNSSNNVLSNVALQGGLNLTANGSFAHLVNGTSFSSGDTIQIGATYDGNQSGNTGSLLSIDENLTLNHNTLTFGNNYYGSYNGPGWANELVIDGGNTLTVDHGSVINGGPGVIQGSYYTAGSSTLDNHGTISFNMPGWGGQYVPSVIGGNGLDTVINESDGLIEVNNNPANNPNNWDQALIIQAANLNNLGTLQAISTNSSYADLYLNPGSYAGIGQVIADGSYARVFLQGGSGLTTGNTTGFLARNNGSIYLQTTLDNTGGNFDLGTVIDPTGGHFILSAGHILNGNVYNSQLLGFDSSNNLLDGVTLHGGLNLAPNGSFAHLVNGTSFSSGDTVQIGSTYDGNQSTSIGSLLSIDENLTLNHNTITFGNNYYGTYTPYRWANELVIDGGNTLTVDHGSTINGGPGVIQGSYYTSGSSTLDNHGTISFNVPGWGGQYTSSVIGGNGLDTVINESDGLIEVNNNAANNPNNWNQSLTIQAANLNNLGTLQAISTNSSYADLTLNPGSYAGIGQVIADGSYARVFLQGGSGLTTGNTTGFLARNNGSIYLSTTLDNTGSNFDLGTVIDPTGGHFILSAGHILNGDVYNSQLLSFDSSNNLLDGVTLHGGLNLTNPYSYAHLVNGTTFSSGDTVQIGPTYNSNYSTPGSLLSIDENLTLNHNTITLGNSYYGAYPYSTYYSNNLIIDGNSTLTVDHGSTINSAAGIIRGNYYTSGSSTLDNHGTISYNAPAWAVGYGNGFIGGNGLDTIINESDGLIEVNNSPANNPNNWNQSLTIQAANLTNLGTLQAISTNSSYADLYLNPTTYAGMGQVIANGAYARVFLQGGGGNVNGAGFTTAAANAGLSTLNGGSIYLSTTLDNTGNTFDPTAITGPGGANGSFILSNGRILNGSVANSMLLRFDTGDNRLDGVALDGSLDLTPAGTRVHLLNGTTFNNANPGGPLAINIGGTYSSNYNSNGSALSFDENYTLANTTVTFGNSYYAGYPSYAPYNNILAIDGNSTLTIGHDTLIHGAAGIIRGDYYTAGSSTLDNHGTISFDSPAWGQGYENGQIGGNGLDTIINESDGLIELSNTAANNPNLWNQSLTLTANSLTNLGTLHAISDNNSYADLYVNPNIYASLGTVKADGAYARIFLQGGGGYLSGTGFTTAASAGISAVNGGTIYLQTTLDNTGATFDPTAITGVGPSAGNLIFSNGRILGGSVVNSILLRFDANDNVLDGVALDGYLDLSNGGHVRLIDGTSFNNANPGAPMIFNVGLTTPNNYITPGGILDFDDTRTLSNTVVTFGNSYYGGYDGNNYANYLIVDGNNTLTIGHDTLIHGASGVIRGNYYDSGYGTLDNHGVISFDSPTWANGYGSSIGNYLASVVNENDGLIEVNNSAGNNPNNWNQSLTIQPGSLSNMGVIQAVNTSGGNAYLYIAPTTYTNVGTMLANGANAYLYLQGGGGNVSGAGFTTAQSAGLSVINGGTIYLSTTLDNTGATFDPTAITGPGNANGSFVLYNGRILNGSIVNTALLQFSTGDNRLDGITSFDAGLNLANGGYAHLLATTDLAAFPTNATFTINNGGALALEGFGGTNARTLDNFTIQFGATGTNEITAEGSSVLTLGPSLTLTGKYGLIGGSYNGWGGPGQLYTGGYNSVINNTTISSETAGGSWTVNPNYLTNNAVVQAKYGAGLTLEGSTWGQPGSTFLNSGSVIADGSDGMGNPSTVTIDYYALTNNGSLKATNGGTLNLYPNGYTTIGNIVADGAGSNVYLNLWQGAGIALQPTDTLVASNGGTINLQTTLLNSGQTFDPQSITGTGAGAGYFQIYGGSIQGGTLVNPLSVEFAPGQNNRLDGVTVTGGGLDLSNGGWAHIINGTTFDSGATFAINNGGLLSFDQTYTLDNATVNFGDTGTNRIVAEGANTLTLGSNLTLTGKYGVIGGSYNGWGGPGQQFGNNYNTVINNTTLSSETPGGSWTVNPNYLTNNATLQAKYGGSMTIEGSGWSQAGSTFVNTGNVIADGSDGMGIPSTVNIINYTLTNNGILAANNGGTLIVNPYAYARVGQIQSNGAGSNVYLYGGSAGYIALGAGDGFSSTGAGTFWLETTLDNTGQTFDTTSLGTAKFIIQGGRILNGVVNSAADNLSFATSGDNRLDGVTLSGSLDLTNGGLAHVVNSFTTQPGVVFNLNNGAALAIDSNVTLDNGTVAFGDTGTNRLTAEGNNTLTLGSNLTLTGKYGVIGGSYNGWGGPAQVYSNGSNSVINNTTISSATSGGNWTINPYYLTNNGTLQAQYGGKMNLSSWADNSSAFLNAGNVIADGSDGMGNPSTVNLNSYILTNNGVMQATNGGTLNLQPYRYAQVGNINADGAGSTVTLYNPNVGSMTLTGGDNISATNGGTVYLQTTLYNTGHTLDIGATGSFLLNSAYISGGSIVNSNHLGVANYANNILQGVALDGGLNVSGGLLHVYSDTTFGANPVFTIANNGLLSVEGDRTLTGANITFGSDPAAGNNRFAIEGNATLTLDAASTVTAGYGTLGYQYFAGGSNTLINNGSITDNLPGGSLTIATRYLTNNGALAAINGGQITINNTYSGAMTNTGTLMVGSGSTINVYPYGISQTGVNASTTVDGTLQLNGYTLALNGGTLNGKGDLYGSVTNAATVTPGNPVGSLTLHGNYTQTSLGTLSLLLGGQTPGSDYGLLNVTGTASLDGTLSVGLTNNFHPLIGETFDILNYGGRNGVFANEASPSGFGYTVTYNDALDEVILKVVASPFGVYWGKPGDGDWSEAASWVKQGMSGNLPGPTDDVANTSTFTITHSMGNDTIQSFFSQGKFNLTGGVLDVVGPHNTVEVDNTFTLDGGTLQDANVLPGSGGQGITFTQNVNNVLNNVTLNFALDLTNGGWVRIDPINLNGNPVLLDNGAILGFDGAQTFGNATVNFGDHGMNFLSAEGNGILTLGAGLNLTGSTINIGSNLLMAGAGGIINGATLTADNGQTLNIVPALFSNMGTLQATNGGGVNLDAAAYGQIGSIAADGYGSTVYLRGGLMTLSPTDSFQTTGGGRIYLQNTLNLAHAAFDAGAASGFFVDGGTLQGGLIQHADQLQFTSNPNNTLDGDTIDTSLNLTNGASVRIINGLTQLGGAINLDNSAHLTFGGGSTISNLAVHFGNYYNENNTSNTALWNQIEAVGGGTVQLGGGLNLTGAIAYLTSDANTTVENTGVFTAGSGQNVRVLPSTLVNDSAAVMQATGGGLLRLTPDLLMNHGTLAAFAGSALTVAPASWGTVGLIQSNGSLARVYLGGGTLTLDSSNAGANLLAGNGGAFTLETTIDNTGKYFSAVDIGGVFTVQNGGFQGGRINTTTSLFQFAPNADNVLLNTQLTKLLTPAQQAQVMLDPNLLSGLNLNNGGWAHIEGTLDSNGQFLLDNSAHLTFDSDRSFSGTNSGTFVVGTGVINFNGNTLLTDNTTVTGRNLVINEAQTLTNNIALTSENGSEWQINADTIYNDTIVPNGPNGPMTPSIYALISAGRGGSLVLNVNTLYNGDNGNNLELMEARDGGELVINAANYATFGHIQAVNGGSIVHYLGGTITLTGTKPSLSGDFSDTMRAYGNGVNALSTTLDLGDAAENYLDLAQITDQVSGNLLLEGGTIRGGYLNSTSPYLTFAHAGYWYAPYYGYYSFGYSTLDNVVLYDGTLASVNNVGIGTPDTSAAHLAGLNLNNGGWVRIVNAPPTPWSNYQFQLDNDAHLQFADPNVVFGTSTGNGAAFTFGNGGGTLAGDVNSNITFNAGTTLTGGNINITMNGGTLTVNSGVPISANSLTISSTSGDVNLNGGATILANSVSTSLGSGALNLNAGLNFSANSLNISGGTLNNNINLEANAGQTYVIEPGTLNNYSVIGAINGGTTILGPSNWNLIGSIRSDGFNSANNQVSAVYLRNGVFSNANNQINSELQASGGGVFVLQTEIDNTGTPPNGSFVNPVAIGGNLIFQSQFYVGYAQLLNGRLNSDTPNLSPNIPVGTPQVVFAYTYNDPYAYPGYLDNILNGVTLTKADGATPAGLDLTNGGSVSIFNSLTSNNQFLLDNGARLSFVNNAANMWELMAGTTVSFGTHGASVLNPLGSTLILDHGVTLTGTNAYIGMAQLGYEPVDEVDNHTLISSHQGGTWTVAPTTFINYSDGMLEASNGSTLNVIASYFSNSGAATASGGSTVSLDPTTWGNIGALTASGPGSTIILAGGAGLNAAGQYGISPDVPGVLPFTAPGGGTIVLETTLNLDNPTDPAHPITLDTSSLGGYFILKGGTVNGGTILLNAPNTTQYLQFAGGYTDTLENITLRYAGSNALADLDLTNGASVRLVGAYTASDRFLLDHGASVSFDGNRDFSNYAFLIGPDVPYYGSYAGSVHVDGTVTINPSTVIAALDGVSPAATFALSANEIDSSRPLSAEIPGGLWGLSAGTFNSNAQVQAINGATMSISATLLNNNAIMQAVGNSQLSLSAGTLNNNSTIQALQGAGMTLSPGIWGRVGTLIADGSGSQMTLNGVMTLVYGDSITASNGGQTIMQGTLNLGASTVPFLNPSQAGLPIQGPFAVEGGRINGGVINTDHVTDPDLFLGSATLDAVTLASDAAGTNLTGLDMTQGQHITLLDSLTSNNHFLMDNGAYLRFGTTAGGQWNYGTAYGMTGPNQASFDFGSGATLDVQQGQTVNLDAGTLVNGNNAIFGTTYQYPYIPTGTLINGTTLTANSTTYIFGISNLVNTGTIRATNGGTVILAPQNFGKLGTINADGAGSTIYFNYYPFWPYQAGSMTLQAGDQISATNGGALWLETVLNNDGQTIDLANPSTQLFATHGGTLTLYGARINGGNLNGDALGLIFSHDLPAPYIIGSDRDNVLYNVSLVDGNGNLTGLKLLGNGSPNTGGWAHIEGTLTSDQHFELDNDAHLVFSDDRTFGAGGINASFDFHSGQGGTVYLTGGSTLFLNNGVTLMGTNASIGGVSPYSSGGTNLINTTSISSIKGGTWSLIPSALLENDGTLLADTDPMNGPSTLNVGISSDSLINNSLMKADHGSFLNINAGSALNNSTIEVDNGSTLTLNNSELTNAPGSTINIVDSYLVLNNSTLTNKAGNQGDSGALNITGSGFTLSNSTLNNEGNELKLMSLVMDGSTINNGVVTLQQGATFTNNNNNALNNVTLTAPTGVDITAGYLRVNNGTINAPSINLAGNQTAAGVIDFSGSPTLNVPLITFGTDPTAKPSSLYMEGGTTLNIATGTTISGNIGNIGINAASTSQGDRILYNAGTINSNIAGNTALINLTQFTNTGVLNANNGGNVTIQTNTPPTNTGTISIAAGSKITLLSGLVQGAGLTTVDGQLNAAPGTDMLIQGGMVKGNGSLIGTVDNVAGTVAPGHSPGHLTITGDYTQGSGGALEIQLGGTTAGQTYDLLSVTGNAALAGSLDVELVNGFTPALGETFDFLTYGTHTGQFDQVMPFDNGYSYTVDYSTPNVARLSVSAIAGVPEMSTLGTAALMLTGGGLLLLRRRQQRKAA